MQTRLHQLRNRYFRHVKSEFAFLYFAILGACDAVVTGDGCNQYVWNGIGLGRGSTPLRHAQSSSDPPHFSYTIKFTIKLVAKCYAGILPQGVDGE